MPRFQPEPHAFLRHINTPYPVARAAKAPAEAARGTQPAATSVPQDQWQHPAALLASPSELSRFLQAYQWRSVEVDPTKQAQFDYFLRLCAGTQIASQTEVSHPGRAFGAQLSARLALHGPGALWQYFTTPSQNAPFAGPVAQAPVGHRSSGSGRWPPGCQSQRPLLAGLSGMPRAAPNAMGAPHTSVTVPVWGALTPRPQAKATFGALANAGPAAASAPQKPAAEAAVRMFALPHNAMGQPALVPLRVGSQALPHHDLVQAPIVPSMNHLPDDHLLGALFDDLLPAAGLLQADASLPPVVPSQHEAPKGASLEWLSEALRAPIAPLQADVVPPPAVPSVHDAPQDEGLKPRSDGPNPALATPQPVLSQRPDVARTAKHMRPPAAAAPQVALVQAPVVQSMRQLPEDVAMAAVRGSPAPQPQRRVLGAHAQPLSASRGRPGASGRRFASPRPAARPATARLQEPPLSTTHEPTDAQKAFFVALGRLRLGQMPMTIQAEFKLLLMICAGAPLQDVAAQTANMVGHFPVAYWMGIIASSGPQTAILEMLALGQRRESLARAT